MTMAVPSLRRLSPPMSMVRAGEAPSDLSSETTATGSVAESTAPKAMASVQLQW